MIAVAKGKLKDLADRSRNNRPLVMPGIDGLFVREQTGKAWPVVDDFLSFAEKYQYTPYVDVLFKPFFELVPEYAPHLKWHEDLEESGAKVNKRRRIDTPFGRLSEDSVCHKETGLTFHGKKIIENETDLKSMAWLVEEACRVLADKKEIIRAEILKQIKPDAEKIRARGGIALIHFWMPNLEVLHPFFDQENMIYAMADHRDLLRKLMDPILEYTQFQVELGQACGCDAMQTALWGYEQWSPTIYEEFVLPYIAPVSRRCRESGLLFWVHTCGKMKGLLEQKMYHRFGVLDIMESLNYPPAGDVDDWPRLRRLLPDDTVSKGNIEDSLIRNGPVAAIRKKTLELLRETEGFRHIFSTANGILEDTPIAHFEAMLEAIEEYNRKG